MVHVLILVTFDVFALYESFICAFSLRAANKKPLAHHMSIGHFAAIAAELTPLWILLFGVSGLYQVRQRRSSSSELGRITVAVSCGVMALVVLDYMQPSSPMFPSHAVPVYCLGLGIVFVVLCRQLVRFGCRLAYAQGIGLRRVVLIGGGPIAQRIAADLLRPSRGYRIVAVVSGAQDGGFVHGHIPVHSTLESALAAQAEPIDEVVQADDALDRTEVSRLVSVANSLGIVYRFVPDRYGVYAAASSLTTIDGVPIMQVSLTSLDGWGAVAKRAFDVVASLVLLVLLAPLIALLALLVKLDDPQGPILYRQTRIGRGGESIQVTKFRTMRRHLSTGPGQPYGSADEVFRALGRPELCAEFARDQKVRDDPRVSRIGRWLRTTSLDELPQLVDALRGDLSLIGPRPITTAELDRYGAQRASVLALKPGITGLWQVSGRNDVSYDERVKLDIYYIENWSLKLDLTILARTTTTVLARRGAY